MESLHGYHILVRNQQQPISTVPKLEYELRMDECELNVLDTKLIAQGVDGSLKFITCLLATGAQLSTSTT